MRDPRAKITSAEALAAELGRALPGALVFTNGCFDLLHRGHAAYLVAARALGDVLVVAVNSDDSVRRLKGPTRPINGEKDRAYVVAALESVDHVVIFAEDTPLELIRTLRPDILVKGGDYRPEEVVGADEVAASGGRVAIVPLVEGRSTTAILQRSRTG